MVFYLTFHVGKNLFQRSFVSPLLKCLFVFYWVIILTHHKFFLTLPAAPRTLRHLSDCTSLSYNPSHHIFMATWRRRPQPRHLETQCSLRFNKEETQVFPLLKNQYLIAFRELWILLSLWT